MKLRPIVEFRDGTRVRSKIVDSWNDEGAGTCIVLRLLDRSFPRKMVPIALEEGWQRTRGRLDIVYAYEPNPWWRRA